MKQYTTEELRALSDDDIKSLFLEIRSTILESKRSRQKTIDMKENEIYFCYIVRELENRNI